MQKSQKGFIFSLDAFVAFTLSLAAIYTMIFFSSIPSAYYNTLTQAHFLAKDSLVSLSQTYCDRALYPGTPSYCDAVGDATFLEYLTFRAQDPDREFKFFLDQLIPPQYGYTVNILDQSGIPTKVYSTADETPAFRTHKPHKDRLSASAHILVFQYNEAVKPPENPYRHNTCQGIGGAGIPLCDLPQIVDEGAAAETAVVELIVFT